MKPQRNKSKKVCLVIKINGLIEDLRSYSNNSSVSYVVNAANFPRGKENLKSSQRHSPQFLMLLPFSRLQHLFNEIVAFTRTREIFISFPVLLVFPKTFLQMFSVKILSKKKAKLFETSVWQKISPSPTFNGLNFIKIYKSREKDRR